MSLWRRLRVGLVLVAAIIGALLAVLFFTSGSFLIIDQPRRSDVIVVLAGEAERRPERGFELLAENFAPRLLLDVPVGPNIYRRTPLQLAQEYLENQPLATKASVCPIYGRSTRAETQDVTRCLTALQAHTLLLVTSEYHTRRALSIFRHMCAQYDVSVAAAFDDREFGSKWWQRRQWAKINFDEWTKLVWWEGVDRWR